MNIGQTWKMTLLSSFTVLVVLAIFFHQTFGSMIEIWWNYGTYTHGFVIFPISAYLIWQRRVQLRKITPSFSLLGMVFLALSSALWLLASLVEVTLFMQVAFISMIICSVWALLGLNFFKASLFPLMYLFFAVPFGEQLIPAMIDVTAEFTVWAIHLTGIPVYQEGRFLTLPTGHWEVAEACSGVRYIIASFALGSIFAYLNYQSFTKRTIFIVLSLLVPVLANGLRAFGIIMIGHFSGMTLAVGVDHLIYGWVFFGFVMFVLFWAGMFWADDEVASSDNQPVPIKNDIKEISSKHLISVTLITLLVAISGGLVESFLRSQQGSQQYVLNLPLASTGWQGPMDIKGTWEPIYLGAQALKAAEYKTSESSVKVYLAHYEKETEGKELISSTNRLFNPDKWEDESTKNHQAGPALAVKEVIYRGAMSKKLVWWWYEIGGKQTNQLLMGKVYQVINILSLNNTGNRVVAISTDYDGNIEESREKLEDFIRQNPIVTKSLGLIKKS